MLSAGLVILELLRDLGEDLGSHKAGGGQSERVEEDLAKSEVFVGGNTLCAVKRVNTGQPAKMPRRMVARLRSTACRLKKRRILC